MGALSKTSCSSSERSAVNPLGRPGGWISGVSNSGSATPLASLVFSTDIGAAHATLLYISTAMSAIENGVCFISVRITKLMKSTKFSCLNNLSVHVWSHALQFYWLTLVN